MTSSRRLQLVVEPRADASILRRHLWWQENRNDKGMFARAIRAGYKELRRNQSAGTKYDDVESVRRLLLETGHWLYFTLIDEPPLARFILVLDIQGPGEGKEPVLTRTV